MQKLKSFDPQEFQGKIVEVFTSCPSIMSLVKNSCENGYSEINCGGSGGGRTLYIPKQEQAFLRCNQIDGFRYLMIKVSTVSEKIADHWLVICSFSREGWLLKIST